jgi:hypothetical protein
VDASVEMDELLAEEISPLPVSELTGMVVEESLLGEGDDDRLSDEEAVVIL